MYPYITLGSVKIYMMGVGLIVAILVFLYVTRQYAKRYGLNFTKFLKQSPKYIIITYLLGSYSWHLIERLVFFPIDWEYLLLYLSPYQYQFHYVGIVVGLLVSGVWFLRSIPRTQRQARLSAFTHALLLSLIPLGVGLVLGDNFIGQTTQGNIYISAMKDDSMLAAYDKVIPLGLYISLFGLMSHLLISRREQKTDKMISYLGIAWFFLGIGTLLLFQQYPRHLVVRWLDMSWDIKQYISFGTVLILLFLFISRKRIRSQ